MTTAPVDLDLRATLRAALPEQVARGRAPDAPFAIHAADLRRRRRAPRPRRLVLFLVDLSGSMGTALMALAREACAELLASAHVERERLALAGFRGRRAALLVPPTDHPEQLRRPLARLACGGTTPLAAGLRLAAQVLAQDRRRAPGAAHRPVLVVISDGRHNAGRRPGQPALDAELALASRPLAAEPGLARLLLDPTPAGKRDASARDLAALLHAHRLPLRRLGPQDPSPAALVRRWLEEA